MSALGSRHSSYMAELGASLDYLSQTQRNTTTKTIIIYTLHLRCAVFFWHKPPLCVLSGKGRPAPCRFGLIQSLSPFLKPKGSLLLTKQFRPCSHFSLGMLKKKMLSETVPPFRNSKYIRELLLFFKITGIFLGNY